MLHGITDATLEKKCFRWVLNQMSSIKFQILEGLHVSEMSW